MRPRLSVLQTLMNTGYGDKFNYTAQAAEAISQLKLDTIRGKRWGGSGEGKETRLERSTLHSLCLHFAFGFLKCCLGIVREPQTRTMKWHKQKQLKSETDEAEEYEEEEEEE